MKLIYAIQHNVTKRIYVGCTETTGRIRSHFVTARRKKHIVPLVNEDCEKYGFNFTAYMLEVVPDENGKDAYAAEQKWMHYFNTGDPKYGYNYRDKKAMKKPIDSFPVYTDIEWSKKRGLNLPQSKSSVMQEVLATSNNRNINLRAVSQITGIPEKRLNELFADNRKLRNFEVEVISEFLDEMKGNNADFFGVPVTYFLE